MKIKPFEIVISLLMITTSILSLNSGQSYFKGFPVYHWVEYIVLAVGFLFPICAWLLRSSKKNVIAGQEKATDIRVFICPSAKQHSPLRKCRMKPAPNVKSKWNRLMAFMTATRI